MPGHAAPTPSLDDNGDDDNDGTATVVAAAAATREGTVQASSAREAPHSIVFSSSGMSMVSVLFFPAEPNIVVLININKWKTAFQTKGVLLRLRTLSLNFTSRHPIPKLKKMYEFKSGPETVNLRDFDR
jgi:hypothetical protein